MDKLRKRLEELWEKNSKNKAFFEDLGIKKDNFRKLFTENGNPGAKTLLKIANSAGVSMAWLFGETEEADYASILATAETERQRIHDQLGQSERLITSLQQLVDAKDKIIEDKDIIIKMKEEKLAELHNQFHALRESAMQGIPLLDSVPSPDDPRLPARGKTAAQKNIGASRK